MTSFCSLGWNMLRGDTVAFAWLDIDRKNTRTMADMTEEFERELEALEREERELNEAIERMNKEKAELEEEVREKDKTVKQLLVETADVMVEFAVRDLEVKSSSIVDTLVKRDGVPEGCNWPSTEKIAKKFVALRKKVLGELLLGLIDGAKLSMSAVGKLLNQVLVLGVELSSDLCSKVYSKYFVSIGDGENAQLDLTEPADTVLKNVMRCKYRELFSSDEIKTQTVKAVKEMLGASEDNMSMDALLGLQEFAVDCVKLFLRSRIHYEPIDVILGGEDEDSDEPKPVPFDPQTMDLADPKKGPTEGDVVSHLFPCVYTYGNDEPVVKAVVSLC